MTTENRITAINNATSTGEKKTIRYKHVDHLLDVKQIPLGALLYNPYNGRIRSLIKSFESAQQREINNEDEKDIEIIEQYLYDSAKGKNDKTLESLRENGQQEVGIVTKDGVIIDGNRRACLLNIIRKGDESRNYFKAVVLPDQLKDNEREITLLETRYQMGVDSKVDYNPIEKYIRCYELKEDHDLDLSEIAEIMAESEPQITAWLSIFNLMEEYLIYLKTPRIYTRLEKREGHFVDLLNYLNQHEKNLIFSDDDLAKLKEVYFDYIRLGIPVLRARVIGRPTGANSFFSRKEIWNDFIKDHTELKASYTDLSFDGIRAKNPSYSNEDVIRQIDNAWKDTLEDSLIENLSYYESDLKDLIETYAPLKLLQRIQNNVDRINVESMEPTTKEDVIRLINKIQSKLTNLLHLVNQN
ncbi:hypothetical protein GCM10007415_40110 [Parapedobacter pyrenivorans]|uniref:ParB/Sulfiredoxin domain-containing protein n=1 Tax=Parapedobacter pyrenivorans TaxID=1305674 RepID=A0A917MGF7_9SPHI|nr:ParB/RepB/Spo0J family partition protein [Parapedobacter pyrenivorans]GGH00175.1 hypothetical protein GCM10007415_40110 [Parapedobacter pyrenivorans]